MAKKTAFETATNTYIKQITIGDGGSGTVYRVTDIDGVDYALKLLRDAGTTKRKRFKNELGFCRRNQHDRIVRVLDEGILLDGPERLPFYVMPLYDSTLRKLIARGTPLGNALALFVDVLDGVEAAHLQNVIHRDIKPENLLIEVPGPRVVVADFGIAHFEEEDLLTAVKTGAADRLANYRYSAPEQRTHGRAVDHRADIFALGLILNEIFTGEVPQGTAHRRIGTSAPDFAYLDPIVDQMIRQDPNERPASVRAIKDELTMRGAEFVTHQKLDKIRMAVVPATTPDDPLGGTDVEAVGFGYVQGFLTFKLEPAAPPGWMSALHTQGNYRNVPGIAEPARVELTPGGARVPANEQIVAVVAQMVKEWVRSANLEYRERFRRTAQKMERDRIEALAQRRLELEEQLRAMERLRQAELT